VWLIIKVRFGEFAAYGCHSSRAPVQAAEVGYAATRSGAGTAWTATCASFNIPVAANLRSSARAAVTSPHLAQGPALKHRFWRDLACSTSGQIRADVE